MQFRNIGKGDEHIVKYNCNSGGMPRFDKKNDINEEEKNSYFGQLASE